MPFKGGRITPMERRFIRNMVLLGDPAAAAWKAGMSDPKRSGGRALARPAVRAEIVKQSEEILFNELLPLAIETHRWLLTAESVPAGARVQATKLAYDRTLGDGQGADPDKDPAEMTIAELRESIAKLRQEEASRPGAARDVTPAEEAPEVLELEPSKSSVFD